MPFPGILFSGNPTIARYRWPLQFGVVDSSSIPSGVALTQRHGYVGHGER